MVGILLTDTDILLSFLEALGKAQACWTLIDADVGSTSTLAGVKMLKLDNK